MNAPGTTVRYLSTPRMQPPVFSLTETIQMLDAADEIENLAWKVAVELPMLLSPVKACA